MLKLSCRRSTRWSGTKPDACQNKKLVSIENNLVSQWGRRKKTRTRKKNIIEKMK